MSGVAGNLIKNVKHVWATQLGSVTKSITYGWW
jgi:hypothetical protein